ncbi:hypothetical protein ESCNG_160030 [Neisseria gonorrhoeae]|nr:hypothetical protein ESCNG_160030 [Neisseria gonorrhoeae]
MYKLVLTENDKLYFPKSYIRTLAFSVQ